MTFLSRPVFEFPVNWAGAPAPTWEYDLREIQHGHGRPSYAPAQNHLLHGFAFDLDLETDQAIQDFEDFFDALLGNLTGFWLPGPQMAFTIAAGVSTSVFDIEDIGLADDWEDHPVGEFVYFTNGSSSQAAQITSVADLGNGRERVTLTAPLTTAVDATWTAHRLHYVRVAGEAEEFESLNDGFQRRSLKVVELPEEYAAVETGQRPVYLYHFWINAGGTLVHWRYTSFPESITSNANLFSAANLTHGALRDALRGDREDTTLKAVLDSTGPFALLMPITTSRKLWLEIISAPYATPNSATVLFTGQVQPPECDGLNVTAKCLSLLDALGAQLISMLIQKKCNYQVGTAATCKKDLTSLTVSTTITALAANKVTLAAGAGLGENWFAGGLLVTGTGLDQEIADILQSADNGAGVDLWLAAPLYRAVTTQAVTITPGCDKTPEMCTDKFNNYLNFGGHPFVPAANPALKQRDTTVHGNKK